MDQALWSIVNESGKLFSQEDGDLLVRVMRQFLRVQTTLVRAFPIHRHDSQDVEQAVEDLLNWRDASNVSWQEKFCRFIEFLVHHCSPLPHDTERRHYLEAVQQTETGRIPVRVDELTEDIANQQQSAVVTWANIREATGKI